MEMQLRKTILGCVTNMVQAVSYTHLDVYKRQPCRRAQGQKNIILQVQRDGRGLPAAVLLHHGDGAGHLRGGGAVRGGQQGGGKVVAVFCPGALFQGEELTQVIQVSL